jgi:TonB family protein
MTPMPRIRYAIAATFLVSALWAQNGVPPPSTPKEPEAVGQSVANPDQLHPTLPEMAGASTPPTAAEVLRPVYPPSAERGKLQGKVLVKVVISESGEVESAEAVSGDPTLAQAAIYAAKQWKFKPYLKNGSSTKVAMNLPFAFIYLDNPKAQSPLVTTPESFWRDTPRDLITIRLSQEVAKKMLSHGVVPAYPPIAKAAGIGGAVAIFVVIGKDGAIQDLHLISGHPLLTHASLDALKQWRYKPLLLDGQPIDAQTVVVVDYTPDP